MHLLPDHRLLSAAALAAAILLNAGCDSGTGVDGRTADGQGVGDSVGVVEAEWLVIDLVTGVAESRRDLSDLATNPAYRSTKLVVRRIAPPSAVVGSAAGERWALDDETRTTVTPNPYFMAVFELTRGQWRHLSATTPWSSVTPAALAGLTDDDHLPLCGASLEQIAAACGAWRLPGRLTVPGAEQWEIGCRGGTTGIFSWGEQIDEATVRRFAVVRQTAGGGDGPHPVGEREPNAYGLYDTHGNVWEWVADGTVRGGSWHDGLPMARSANRVDLDRSTPYALAGVRLIYAP